jgi:hypothetical protein
MVALCVPQCCAVRQPVQATQHGGHQRACAAMATPACAHMLMQGELAAVTGSYHLRSKLCSTWITLLLPHVADGLTVAQ